MPTVPQYEIGQVKPQGINARQRINAPADAFGANVARAQTKFGQALEQTSDLLFGAALKERDRHDDAVLREMDTSFSEYIRGQLDDPQSGFHSKRGKDALNSKDVVRKAIEDYEAAQRKKLDPRLANSWGKLSTARMQSAFGKIDSHAQSEFRVYEEATSKARIESQIDEMGTNAGDDKAINMAKAVGLIEIEQQAERNGWHKDVLDRERSVFLSKGHKAVIDRFMASGQPSRAKMYYERHKEEILGTVRDDLEKKLETETLRAQAQRKSDEIVAMGLTREEAMGKAREIEDSKLRDETVKRVEARFDEVTKIENEQKKKVKQEAWQVVIQSGSTDELTADQLAVLDGTTVAAMESFAAKKRKGIEPTQDWEAWHEFNELLQDAIAGDPEAVQKLVDTDVFTEYRNKLDNSHFDAAITRQTSFITALQSDSGGARSELNAIVTNKVAADLVVEQIVGKKKSKWNNDHRAFAARFFSLLQSQMDLWSADHNGQRVPAQERDRIIDGLVGSVEDKTGWFDLSLDREYTLADVPNDATQIIMQELSAQSVPITAENIINTWLIGKKEGIFDE